MPAFYLIPLLLSAQCYERTMKECLYSAMSYIITPVMVLQLFHDMLPSQRRVLIITVFVCVFRQRTPSCARMIFGCWMVMILRSPFHVFSALITWTSYALLRLRMTSSETHPTIPSWSARWGPGCFLNHSSFFPFGHLTTWSRILRNGL